MPTRTSFIAAACAALVACTAASTTSNLRDPEAAPSDSTGTSPSSADDASTPTLPPADADDAGSDGGTTENRNLGLSAGCGNAVGATGLQKHTMKIAGVTREYLHFVPAGAKSDKPLATVIALHGSGGTMEKTRASFDLEAEAKGNAIFVYPQALPDPTSGDNRWDPVMGSNDYAFVDALVAEVEATRCVDRDRLFVVGFSLGARFTSMLGCYRGDKIRAIAPVAPGMNAQSLPLAVGPCVGEVGIWEGLGDDDADHREGALLVRDYYRAKDGCSTTLTPTTPAGCQSYAGCRTETPVVWCTYPGGHMWPPIGAQGVWGFFSKFE